MHRYPDSIFKKYLKILMVSHNKPGLSNLTELIQAHLMNIPFENISKLYYKNKFNLMNIPDFDMYLEGISKYHFGGTCYSNNYYLNQLLWYLGYNVRLCGADMNNPDVHMVNIVTLNNREYLVDVGYAAPFLNPIPVDLNHNYEIIHGGDKYIISPRNTNGHSELKMFRDGEVKHGYMVKPQARIIDEFEDVIKDSFRDSATFLNSVLLVLFRTNSSIRIHNFSVVESNDDDFKQTELQNINELIECIITHFAIPKQIVMETLDLITTFGDSWT